MTEDTEVGADEEWVKRVLQTRDTPLRTHLITLTYNKLAAKVYETIFEPYLGEDGGHVTPNANWFNFATWGTYSVGPNIRDDAAPQRLSSLTAGLRRRITPAIVHSRSADGNLVGQALAWGQYLIFASVTTAGIKFLQPASVGSWVDRPSFKLDVSGLPRQDGAWLDTTHGDLIDEAFGYYWWARTYVAHLHAERDSASRDPGNDPIVCRLILLGTILLTAVEQDIIDGALRTVIDAVPVRWLRYVDERLAAAIATRRGLPRQAVALNLLDQIARVGPDLTDSFARLMTDQMLVMCLPRETLRVGRNIPPLDATSPMYPLALSDLAADERPSLPEDSPAGKCLQQGQARLKELVSSLDRTGTDGAGSAARDWRRFDDRLNWAICLFRSRQQDPTLFWPAYSQEDERRLDRDRLPRGRSAGPPPPPWSSEMERAISEFLRGDQQVTNGRTR